MAEAHDVEVQKGAEENQNVIEPTPLPQDESGQTQVLGDVSEDEGKESLERERTGEDTPNTTTDDENIHKDPPATDAATEEADDRTPTIEKPDPSAVAEEATTPAAETQDESLPPQPTVEEVKDPNADAQTPETVEGAPAAPTDAPSEEKPSSDSVPPEAAALERTISAGIPIPIITETADSPTDVAPEQSQPSPEPPRTPTAPAPAPPTPSPSTPAPSVRSESTGRVTTASLAQSSGTGQITISSMVFVVSALETIGASKEARRRKPLSDAVQRAIDAIRETAPEPPADPTIVFEPLRIACGVPNQQLVTTALDCIQKLISYSYFSIVPPRKSHGMGEDERPEPPLIEVAIDTICDCFQGEQTPDAVQLQIVKALLAAVLNDTAIVHGAGLLKAVRQTYNIFLLSRNSANQQTAQGSLTQMVRTVFERVRQRIAVKEAREDGRNRSGSSAAVNGTDAEENGHKEEDESVHLEHGPQEKITLQSFENRKSFDDDHITESAPTTVTPAADAPADTRDDPEDEEESMFVKDAFLVFRSMCKLSIKPLTPDQIADLKSHGMRSKLLSLHLIHVILRNHMDVFLSPYCGIKSPSTGETTPFIHAIKQYLCLSLSRNAASAVGNVFEVCCEIFWLMMTNMRVMLKKEVEVFLKEIYLTILDNRHSSVQQKQYLLGVLERLCSEPRTLVEVYLNYDCDSTALDNMYQRIVEQLARIATSHVPITDLQLQQYEEHQGKVNNVAWKNMSTPPSLSVATITATQAITPPDPTFPVEYTLKRQSLQCLIDALQSLVKWSERDLADALQRSADAEESRESLDRSYSHSSPRPSSVATPIAGTPHPDSLHDFNPSGNDDDPVSLEKAKQRKTAFLQAVQQFNFKPKRGIKAFISQGFIENDSPEAIGKFLLDHNSSLSKKMIGEYLGEGDAENVAAMHAFVDQMDFTRMRFVDALRRFLQSFRLPGEAQKIDRFMLKFAERYISGNPNAFANADTAYVLAYSVIMLNTDQHSEKLKGKNRMTREDFIKNNRGINDDADLPDEYLTAIYEEIRDNEIVLEDENAAKLDLMTQQSTGGIVEGIGRVIANAGRDLEREAYVQASEEMANKTEQLFRTLLKAQRKGSSKEAPAAKYFSATSSKHVGPMFEVTWMSFLSSLSGAAQESHDVQTIRQCMEGFKLAIRIACAFELETSRIAFVTALAKFTHLNNLSEMKAKNVEALKALLEVAQTEGNLLKSSWRDVLTCISQLERFQLISSGVDEGAVPDVTKARFMHQDETGPRSSMSSVRTARTRHRANTTTYIPEVAQESRSREIVVAVDRIFANSNKLSGQAIVHFVGALSEVSWQEIQSSGQSENPRMFSLQKLVEISYYNMGRIRVEWSNIWNILGEHFNQVGCHSNTNVVFFALDSLRQLAMRFLEIEELPHFKFQKDFLRPFEYIMKNTTVVRVKDMVLTCLSQMLQARGNNITSGWKAMFGVFTLAASETYDSIVNLAFENVRKIYRTRFGVIVNQGAFADMIMCITEFSKNHRFQKVSLQAIETLKGTVPVMLECPECPLSEAGAIREQQEKEDKRGAGVVKENPYMRFWFPVLGAFHDILMTGEDLEARTRAVGYLFDTLIKYGDTFPPEFWDTVCHELLFPIFTVLKSRSEMIQFNSQETVGLWLSTTMIQALRKLIGLLTHYFDQLERKLELFLELLVTCICQENDTIARIGSTCLQQLILETVHKLQPQHWNKIVGAFVTLFELTTANDLFSAASSTRTMSSASMAPPRNLEGRAGSDAAIEEEQEDNANVLKISGLNPAGDGEATAESSAAMPDAAPLSAATTELEDYRPQQLQQQPVVTAQRRRYFNRIITKCVLQLLMIETVSDLFQNNQVYDNIPSAELLRLMTLLKNSFSFARRFNSDKELRMKLWREGFMKQPPNLLKQESGSASTYASILLRMYHDDNSERRESRAAIEDALIPLCVDIIMGYVVLEEDTQQRNISAWRPVVVAVLEGYTSFPEPDFERYINTFYPLAVDLLARELGPDIRAALQGLFNRVGEVRGMGIKRGEGSVQRRSSRASSIASVGRGPYAAQQGRRGTVGAAQRG